MRKYIVLNSLISVFLSVLIVLGTSLILFTNTLSSEKIESLKIINKTIKISKIPQDKDLAEFANEIAETSDSLRVTIISPSGDVLADSEDINEAFDNHISREEISEALKSGVGSSARVSRTTGVYTVYAAQKLDNGLILRLAYPVASIYTFILKMVFVIIFVLIAVLACVYAFSHYFSKRLMDPFDQINKLLETKTVMEDKIKNRPFKEVKPLLKNIEYLINKLNNDLSEIKKTEQMRSDFVANASHELKSPLTSIKGFAELMANDLISDEKQKKEYLGRIVSESDRLLNIINDILQLSKAENKDPDRSRYEIINLSELTGEIFKALEPLASKKNISLILEGNASINCEKKELWEIIYNLADNGIRYGNEGGFVKVLLKDGNMTSITVEDNGIGIPQEHKNRVFERFYRVDKSRSHKSGGTGLGLSIVRNLAVKYGGTATLESEEGKGTKITCYLKNVGK